MDRRTSSIIQKIKRHGLKVCCLGCGWLGRTLDCRAGDGNHRIRDLRCPKCDGRLCSLTWAVRNPARYSEKADAELARLRPFRG